MNSDDIKHIVDELVESETSFVLMALTKENDAIIDNYHCYHGKGIDMEDLLAGVLGGTITQLLENGRSMDDIKQEFEVVFRCIEKSQESKLLS